MTNVILPVRPTLGNEKQKYRAADRQLNQLTVHLKMYSKKYVSKYNIDYSFSTHHIRMENEARIKSDSDSTETNFWTESLVSP